MTFIILSLHHRGFIKVKLLAIFIVLKVTIFCFANNLGIRPDINMLRTDSAYRVLQGIHVRMRKRGSKPNKI